MLEKVDMGMLDVGVLDAEMLLHVGMVDVT